MQLFQSAALAPSDSTQRPSALQILIVCAHPARNALLANILAWLAVILMIHIVLVLLTYIISYPLILSLINKFNYSIVCSDCPASSYIQSACGGTQNTVCKTCTTCTGLTYELQPCVRGLDAVCASCKICTFPSAYVGQVCEAAGWFWWYLSNCCYDESGSLVSFF